MTSALVSSIHMYWTVTITFKRSLSHDSENHGNSYLEVGSQPAGVLRCSGLTPFSRTQVATAAATATRNNGMVTTPGQLGLPKTRASTEWAPAPTKSRVAAANATRKGTLKGSDQTVAAA